MPLQLHQQKNPQPPSSADQSDPLHTALDGSQIFQDYQDEVAFLWHMLPFYSPQTEWHTHLLCQGSVSAHRHLQPRQKYQIRVSVFILWIMYETTVKEQGEYWVEIQWHHSFSIIMFLHFLSSFKSNQNSSFWSTLKGNRRTGVETWTSYQQMKQILQINLLI